MLKKIINFIRPTTKETDWTNNQVLPIPMILANDNLHLVNGVWIKKAKG